MIPLGIIFVFRQHKLVYLRFLDHSAGPADTTQPIICEVFGILRDENKDAYMVASWICDTNLRDANTDIYCILKKVVLEYRVLEVQNEDANERGHKEG
jgi:hypothetical protein